MTDADFRRIARSVQAEFGIFLPDIKRDLVYSRLLRRLRTLGLADFAAYCDLVESGAGLAERTEMLSALTTNVTHFFREMHHFDQLRTQILPPLLQAARNGGRVRLWSAGCSSGQEPYSIALTLLDLLPDASRYDIRILATDVDPQVIARARAGHYAAAERESIPEPMRSQFTETGADGLRIGEAARALITFAPLNLMGDWPMRGAFDVIMCRNVAIYFDAPTQVRLWDRFTSIMQPGAHLLIGHSERIAGPAEALLENIGTTAYRLRGHPAEAPVRSAAERSLA
ncbi:protein-glutamate O-methyltransferase CheR [Tabrizicola sp.]|uniref:CheR family methyltransferase n=1 Tax=Tabrizicola sp. TaxID=2005166 RepID=UPI0035B0069E